MGHFETERIHVERLLSLLEMRLDTLSNLQEVYSEETGVDVMSVIDGQKIGIQVTEYNPEDGLESKPKRNPRGAEKKLARNELDKSGGVKSYGLLVPADYIAALKTRIKNKLLKSSFSFDKVWLLITSQNPDWGSTSSTFVSSPTISVSEMNRCLHPL
jgi:hypothetical protein